MSARFLTRRALEELGTLQSSVRTLAHSRNMAFRIFAASRFVAVVSAQRELWLEFAWADQEYRYAVRRLAQFCTEHRHSVQPQMSTQCRNAH